MFEKGRKVISALTVILLLVLSVMPCALAVEYPEGVSKEQVSATIKKTDIMIKNLTASTKEGSLENLILPQIYTDEVLSALTVGIYSAIEENAEGISALGLDVSTKGVAEYLGAYPEVREKLAGFSRWSDVRLEDASWGVSDKESFIKATASVLAPFNELLYTLLCGGRYSINPVIGFEGAKGYETAVIPTLKSLGCESITDSRAFYAEAESDKNSMLENILGDLFILVERVLDAPCDVLTDILPGIAYFLEEGGLDKAVSALIEPVRLQLFSISTFIKVETILSFVQNSEAYTQAFTLNFNDILSGTGLNIAEINLKELASCGKVNSDGTVTSDKEATFLVLIRWLIDTVKLNQSSLKDMMGEGAAEAENIIRTLLSKDTDELIRMLVGLFNAEKAITNEYMWSFGDFTPTVVEYTPNLTKDKYQRVVDGIDDLINEFIAEGGKNETVRDALEPEIYSNKLVSNLVCELYGLLSKEEMKPLSMIIGLDITPAALANELSGVRFANTRYVLSRAASWDSVNVNKLTWGFKNGDKDGFIKAICGALSPMEDILNMLLCEGKIQLLGSVDIYGSNGYNTAIIPLLEALGCSNDSILTYDEYKKASEKGKGLEALAEALVSLIERILDKPVYTVTEILPNLLYFINNGGIGTCIENLMYPFGSLLKELGMENTLDMSQLTDFNMEDMMAQMMNGADLGVDISGFDIQQFAYMGELVTVKSKRTQGGEFTDISYVKADQTAIIVTLLRFIAEIMKTPGNDDMLMSFMGSGNENDMFANFSGGIGAELEALSVDETVEWLYKIFFRERAVVEKPDSQDYLPTIIYTPEPPKGEGSGIYFMMLFVAAAEMLAIKKHRKIESFFEEQKIKRLLKKQEPQEV